MLISWELVTLPGLDDKLILVVWGGIHTSRRALRVASLVVTFPKMVVRPITSISDAWNAISIVMLSSVNNQ